MECMDARCLRRKVRRLRTGLPALILLMLAMTAPAWTMPLQVVADIRPVQALITALTEDTGAEVRLLLEGEADPHHVTLRPSQVRQLGEADLVFVISREMAPHVDRLEHAGRLKHLVELARAEGLQLLPRRRLDPPGIDRPAPEGSDWHVWTDPRNVILMARAAAQALSAADPGNGERHAANLARLEAALKREDAALERRLKPLSGKAFLLVHDATQYLERRYGLEPLAIVQPDHETAPGPRRMAALLRLVEAHPGLCILSPPGGAMRWARRLREGGKARVGVIDVLGIRLAPVGGRDFWPAYFGSLADAYAGCLGAAPEKR